MKISVYNGPGRWMGRLDVDTAQPPRVARLGQRGGGGGAEHFLDWDRAFDDEGHLRKCPLCGCEELYRRQTLPPLNGFIAVLAVGIVGLVLWGLADVPLWLPATVLGLVIAANLLIHFYSPDFLVCYRCTSRFYGVPISAQHGLWDSLTAARHNAHRSRTPLTSAASLTAGSGATQPPPTTDTL